jgi:hypothetical protein
MTTTVSADPNVPIEYLRVPGGVMAKSTCWPGVSSRAGDSNGFSVGGAAGPIAGYNDRMYCLSTGEIVPGGLRPASWYWAGDRMNSGGSQYSMIESGSHEEPSTSKRLSFWSTFEYVVSWSQLFGGPWKYS